MLKARTCVGLLAAAAIALASQAQARDGNVGQDELVPPRPEWSIKESGNGALDRSTGLGRVIHSTTYADASGSSDGAWTREAAEASLELSRSERRLIQRGLAADGFDPGPADGLFGRGTRGAIRAWQASRGEAATGYLNADGAKALLAAGERDKWAVRAGGERQGAQTAGSVAARQLSERLGRELSPVAVDENGWTDLHYAAVLDLPELAVALLDAGARANAVLKDDGELLGDRLKEVIRSFGLDTFAKTARIGQTPLHLAARQDSANVARLLLDRGSDVERKDKTKGKSDWTPLHYTAWLEAAQVARLLLEHGAEPDTRSLSGETPIHLAAAKNATKVAQLLIDYGADVNAETEKGWTALHTAAENKAGEVAQLLVDRGADVNARSENGWTPLHVAAEQDFGEVAQLLVDHGAEASAKDKKGWAPLHIAAENNSNEVAQLLIDLGVDVDEAVSESGVTPLHIAAGNDALEVAQLLIDRGAHVWAKSGKGYAPLDYAIQHNARDAAKLLVDSPFLGDERSGAASLARAVRHGGFPAASRNLARLYEANAGDPWFAGPFWNEVAAISGWPPVPEDPLEAYDWFDRAARHGFPAGARKSALAETAERAITERWVMSFISAPEHQLREEEELISKINRALCDTYSGNDFTRLQRILKKGSKRFLDRELSVERAYRYVRCNQPFAGNIDLIRITAERPTRTSRAAHDLVSYFVDEMAGGKFLLGKIVMCQRDFGYGCLNVLGHIEKNVKRSEGSPTRIEALNEFKNLLYNNLDEDHLKHSPGFCRAFLDEPEYCAPARESG